MGRLLAATGGGSQDSGELQEVLRDAEGVFEGVGKEANGTSQPEKAGALKNLSFCNTEWKG